ncbi:hypothetical protein HBB16_10380 [Pseudonocardia sp. MCCB 268]|nr:hypothetical protein [Pseudonocardia cytotoxica]
MLETTARRDGDGWVLDGAKKWIGNGSIADVVVVWAWDTEDGQVAGSRGEGHARKRRRTRDRAQGLAARGVAAEIALDGVRVDEADWLPGARSFGDTGGCSPDSVASCAWMALGHAVAGFEAALTPRPPPPPVRPDAGALPDHPAALCPMLADVTAMQLYCSADRAAGRGRQADDTLATWLGCTTRRRFASVLPRPGPVSAGNGIPLTSTMRQYRVLSILFVVVCFNLSNT